MDDFLLPDTFTAIIAEDSGCRLYRYSVTRDDSFDASANSSASYPAPSDKDEELLTSDTSDRAALVRGSSSDSEGQATPRLQPNPHITLRAAGGPCQHCGVKGDN